MGKLTKLRGPFSVRSRVCPVVRPRDLSSTAERKNGLDRERHSWLAHADDLVLGVVCDPRRRVELGVDAVPAPGRYHGALLRLCKLLDDLADLSEGRAGLDDGDGAVESLARGLDDADRLWVRLCAVADVVRLVDVGVVAAVVY